MNGGGQMPLFGEGGRPLPPPDDDRLGRFSNPSLSGAPETQRQTAVAVYPKTGTQRRHVLEAIALTGGLSDEEIETRLQLGQRQCSTRRRELVDDGWVEDSGARRVSRAGYDVVVWTLTEQGRDEWSE